VTAKVVIRVALVIASAAMLQRGLFSQVTIAGVQGDILLLLAISGGIALGPDRGAIIGFISGLTFDLFLYSPLGLRALVFCLVGYVAGRYQSSVTRSSRARLMFTVFLASVAATTALSLVGWVLGQTSMLSARLPVIVLVISVTNAVLSPLAVGALRWAWEQPRDQAPYGAVSYGR
jgi:rod shape-determining protein MreD